MHKQKHSKRKLKSRQLSYKYSTKKQTKDKKVNNLDTGISTANIDRKAENLNTSTSVVDEKIDNLNTGILNKATRQKTQVKIKKQQMPIKKQTIQA